MLRGILLRILFGTVAGLLVAEAAMRLWLGVFATESQYRDYSLYTDMPQSEYQWTPHPYLGYIPTPGFHRDKLSHNSLGFRGPEITVQKPAGAIRIAILGGSTVYGVGIEDNAETFPAQLEQVLRDQFRYPNVQVINASAGAYTSWESLIDLAFRVVDLAPDLVVIYHNVNDVHSRLVKQYKPDNTGRRHVWTPPPVPWWEHSALLRIVSRRQGYTRQAGLQDFVDAATPGLKESVELLAQNPPVYFERNLRSAIAIARANGTKVMLATWAHSNLLGDYAATKVYERGFAENNRSIKRVGQELQVPTLDFAAEMPMDRQYWVDGRHVNGAGAKLQAESFAKFLTQEHLIPAPQ